jgi:hypothetical protein
MRKIFLLLIVSLTALFAEKGDVSIFILKDGKPLSHVEVMIDQTVKIVTDKDGFAVASLNPGKHQAVIDVTENGQMIAFARHNFIIAPDQNTEVVLTLKSDGTVANIDNEASVDVAKFADANGTASDSIAIKARVEGIIISSKDNKPVAKARLFVKGSTKQTLTDVNGRYSLELTEGEQTLSVIHHKFSAKTFKVTLSGENAVVKNITLTPAGIELEEFIVLKPKVAGSVASVLSEKRNEASVSEIMGSEQMSKAGDSKASDALTRVTGVTIVDGKYVVVRGLGDRYTSISLNGFFLPSPDPLKRVVPLDIFPTGVLQSIKVQKSATADKSAEFAGGLVELRTKNIPDEFFMQMGVSTSYDDRATFKMAGSYDGGSLDALGYDDGVRALTAEINDATASGTPIELGIPGLKDGLSSTDLIALTNSLSYTNNVQSKMFLPGLNLNFSMGDKFKLDSGIKVGYFSALSYKYDNDYTDYDRKNYSTSSSGNLFVTSSDDFNVSKESASINAMFGAGAQFNSDDKINWTNLYLHKGTKVVRDSISITANGQKHNSELIWTEESLLSSEVIGEHTFSSLSDLKIDWRGAFTSANLYEPDRISYSFEYDELTNSYNFSETDGDTFTRQFNTLDDTNLEGGFDITLPVALWTKEKAKIKVGTTILLKTRESRSRTLLYDQAISTDIEEEEIDSVVNEENIGTSGDDFVITELENSVGSYDATQELMASYAMIDLPINSSVTFNAGIRFEISSQELRVLNSVTLEEFVDGYALNETADLFPSALLTYKINKDMQLRAGYARTTSRPDFKELSIALVTDPSSGDIFQGNPELESALIDNFDLRFEWYMSKTETFSIALFNKLFTNPIEEVIKPTSDGELFSYENAVGANNQGIELDIRKSLAKYGSVDMSDFYISANYTYISSEIDVTGNTINEGGILTSAVRPMQGQSPYVYNFRFGYDNKDTGLTSTLLYNVFGERIVKVGVQGLPDQYEQPVERLDFVTLYALNKSFRVSFKAANLLDPEYTITQDGAVAYSYNRGRRYSLGLSYKY